MSGADIEGSTTDHMVPTVEFNRALDVSLAAAKLAAVADDVSMPFFRELHAHAVINVLIALSGAEFDAEQALGIMRLDLDGADLACTEVDDILQPFTDNPDTAWASVRKGEAALQHRELAMKYGWIFTEDTPTFDYAASVNAILN